MSMNSFLILPHLHYCGFQILPQSLFPSHRDQFVVPRSTLYAHNILHKWQDSVDVHADCLHSQKLLSIQELVDMHSINFHVIMALKLRFRVIRTAQARSTLQRWSSFYYVYVSNRDHDSTENLRNFYNVALHPR